jgi:chaperonin GroES
MSATLAPPSAAAPPPGAIGAIGAPSNGAGLSPAVQVARQFMPAPPADEPVDDHPNKSHRDQLARWVDMENIAEDPEVEDQIEEIAARVKYDYDIDDNSRKPWKTKYKQWLDLALQIAEHKTYPWPDASNVIYPLMTTAAVQFHARAYPAIIRDRNVVKGTILGNDDGEPNPAFVQFVQQQQQQQQQQQGQPPPPGPGAPGPGNVMPGLGPATTQAGGQPPPMFIPGKEPGAKQARADRIGQHMSWQLLDEQEEWEPQTDSLLIALPIVGTYFRKSYWDPRLRRNVSESVSAMALCVNYHAKSFETAPRHTESIRLYPHEIVESIRAGLFLGPDDDQDEADYYGHDNQGGDDEDGNSQQDEDAATTFLEQHRRWDLDGDGYPEPYIVTVARDSGRLARITCGFEMDGVRWTKGGRIRRIEKVEIYTKYGFIPSPDSKVYDLGFGHLLFPINEAIDTTLNLMFDAGHLQVVGGGFVGSGLSVNTGAVRFQMGEYKPVNTLGGTIRDNVFPIPFPGPNQVLFELLKFLVDAGERVASVKDVMVGDMPGDNTSGITTLAVIEQGLKVFSAIYKRIYRSLGYEFRKLYRLNRIYGQRKSRFKVGEEWREIERADYEEGAGVEPISDPQMVTDMQRLGRAQFLLTFKDDPRVDGKKIIHDALAAAMIPNASNYMNNAPPPEDPKVTLKNKELDIRAKREMIELVLREQHDKALIIKEITASELNLAQVRKLDNDQQLGWVEQHLQMLKDQIDAVVKLSPDAGAGLEGGGGADASGSPAGAGSGAVGPVGAPPGNPAGAGALPAGLPAGP